MHTSIFIAYRIDVLVWLNFTATQRYIRSVTFTTDIFGWALQTMRKEVHLQVFQIMWIIGVLIYVGPFCLSTTLPSCLFTADFLLLAHSPVCLQKNPKKSFLRQITKTVFKNVQLPRLINLNSTRPTLVAFEGQHSGDSWEFGKSMYGLSWVIWCRGASHPACARVLSQFTMSSFWPGEILLGAFSGMFEPFVVCSLSWTFCYSMV